MDDSRYTTEEVSEIVAEALRRRQSHDSVDHGTLLETARELGLSADEIDAVLDDRAASCRREAALAVWKRQQRKEFREHLFSYVAVNIFLVIVDFVTSGGFWAYWVLLAWGLGLAFHWYETMFPDDDEIEKGIRKTLKRMTPEQALAEARRPDVTSAWRSRFGIAIRALRLGR